MNPLEILFVITFVLSGLRFFIPQLMGSRWSALLSLPSLTMLFLLLITGTLRWTMLGLYVLSLILIINDLVYFLRHRRREARLFSALGVTLRLLVTLVAVGSITLSLLFPIRIINDPGLERPVGSRSFMLTDPNRSVECGGQEGFRKLMVQVWYPAEKEGRLKRKPWITDGRLVGSAVARDVGLPGFILSHVGLIPSRAWDGAPLAGKGDMYPVILLSHGWKGFREIHEGTAELLASRGFVVIAPDHTCGSLGVRFPDGSAAPLDMDLLPEGEMAHELFMEKARRLLQLYRDDQLFLINSLIKIQDGRQQNFLTGRLDLSRLALLAHSTGAGAAYWTAMEEPLVGALALLDPWMEPMGAETIRKGVDQPLFILGSDEWRGSPNEPALHLGLQSSRGQALFYSIDGTNHVDFTDVRHLSRLGHRLGLLGELDSNRSSQIINHSLLLFLSQWAGGEAQGIVDGLALYYPEFRRDYYRESP